MSLETFTFLHVVISMVGIMTGFIVVALMLSARRSPAGTASSRLHHPDQRHGLLLSIQGARAPHIVG